MRAASMVSTKSIFDLLAKMNRNNKDRVMGNDILELQRQMKGLDKTLQDLFNGKVAAGLEIDRLKTEIMRLKKGGATTSTQSVPAMSGSPSQAKPEVRPQVSTEGVVWGSGEETKK